MNLKLIGHVVSKSKKKRIGICDKEINLYNAKKVKKVHSKYDFVFLQILFNAIAKVLIVYQFSRYVCWPMDDIS